MLYNVLASAVQQCESAIKVYTYPLPLELLPAPPSYPSRLSQSARLGFLCYTAASHQLSVAHVAVYVCQRYSDSSLYSFPWRLSLYSSPHYVQKPILYTCDSMCALQRGSSVPFSRFHVYGLVYNIQTSKLIHLEKCADIEKCTVLR